LLAFGNLSAKTHCEIAQPRMSSFRTCRFLANVNSDRPSVCRLSVCLSVCLSVTLVHPSQAVEIFHNISMAFSTLAIRSHPQKILRRSSQGTPLSGELYTRGVANYSDFGPIEG